jgi:4-amino-4-deoxy-L-arabinose transferase-like glycosyltransferase
LGFEIGIFNMPLRKLISEYKWLLLILLFACLLRLFGIRFGLPYQYHPDEVKYVILALKVGAVGPNVGYFDNPTGFVYLLFFEYGIVYILGRLLSIFHSTKDLAVLYYQNPTIFYLLGRITSALLGVGTVWLTYAIGKKTFNRTSGLIAAVFLAVSFGHIRDSHFAVPDIPMVFFLMFSLYFIIRFWFAEKNPKKYLLLSAGFAGVAIGFKYTAGLILVPIFLAMILQRNKLGNKLHNQVLSFLGFFVLPFLGFLIVCPYALLDFSKFYISIRFLHTLDTTGYWGIDPDINGYLGYLAVLNWQLGTLLLLAGIIGIGYSLYRDKQTGLMLFIFPIIFYLIFGRSKLIMDRFILPLLPFLAISGARLLDGIREKGAKYKSILLLGFATILIIQPLINAIYCDYLFTKKDTRTLAKEWIEQHLPQGSKIVTEGYGPPLLRSREYLKSQITQEMNREAYQVIELPKSGAATHPLSYYREQGYDYLIVSSFIYLRYWVRPDLTPDGIAFYNALSKEVKPVIEFSPFRDNSNYSNRLEIFPSTVLFSRTNPGPIISIYSLNSTFSQ